MTELKNLQAQLAAANKELEAFRAAHPVANRSDARPRSRRSPPTTHIVGYEGLVPSS
ncbi:Hypothetical protein FKW44_008460 [Caligus rogercresseyi]|uniref:Uncharacterized protein n=1 Tax=Caligus rogercresseyi TaxID=217165 RepID=A0A7T8KG61_CALRO|nr:Hypothetical protein FKW44_008460 [Caligus rogercresseyi]